MTRLPTSHSPPTPMTALLFPTAECPECHRPIQFRQLPPLGCLLLCPHCETILLVEDPTVPSLTWGFEEPISPNEPPLPPPELISHHWRFLRNSR